MRKGQVWLACGAISSIISIRVFHVAVPWRFILLCGHMRHEVLHFVFVSNCRNVGRYSLLLCLNPYSKSSSDMLEHCPIIVKMRHYIFHIHHGAISEHIHLVEEVKVLTVVSIRRTVPSGEGPTSVLQHLSFD